MRLFCHLAIAFSILFAPSYAHATLYDRGGGLIYDSTLNITWLQDANYAKTSGYDPDGLMDWATAKTWASNLEYAGYSDWRLPEIKPVDGNAFNYRYSNNGSTDRGYGNTSVQSELSYLWYVGLGNKGFCTPKPGGCEEQKSPDETDIFGVIIPGVPIWGAKNLGPFVGVDTTTFGIYWIGSIYEPSPDFGAWFFDFSTGLQSAWVQDSYSYPWAVRDGDVGIDSSVAEPGALALFPLAIFANWLAGKRRQRKFVVCAGM